MPANQARSPPVAHKNHIHLHHYYHKPEIDEDGLPVDHRKTSNTSSRGTHAANQQQQPQNVHNSDDMDRGQLSSAIIDMHSQLAKKKEEISNLHLEISVLTRMKEDKRMKRGAAN